MIDIMEVEIHVSEEELAEFPEEATDSTAEQSQSGKTSQTPNQVLYRVYYLLGPLLLRACWEELGKVALDTW